MTQVLPHRDGDPPLVVQVWGSGALFTRPESKVERVTYPVMTPSAAVGVLEAIFWKPEFRWEIVGIEVLRPIKFGSIRRNETSQVLAMDTALLGRVVDTAAERTQRASIYLLDVAYRIHAHALLRGHATEPVAKYRDQFRRRVTRGASFSTPYLGTKEFVAHFGPPDNSAPIAVTDDLGVMLHSITFGDGGRDPVSHWFHARLENGMMRVPNLEDLAGSTL